MTFAERLTASLARLFCVAPATVKRWINGESAPHPLGQESALRAIASPGSLEKALTEPHNLRESVRNETLEEAARYLDEVAEVWKGRKESDDAVRSFCFVAAKNIREMKSAPNRSPATTTEKESK